MNEKKIAVSGGIWTGASSVIGILTQLIRVMILARYLQKSDFGTVAIINMFIGLCLTFADLGFSSVIMYRKHINIIEFSSLFWLQFILYIAFLVLIILGTPFISSFYNDSELMILIPIASVGLVLMALGKLHESVLQKKYDFKIIAIRNIVSCVLSVLLSLYLAFAGYGIYSLILSTLFQTLIYNVWTLAAGYKYQPIVLRFKFQAIRPLIKVGLYQTTTRIFDYFSSQIDIFIIGKLLGAEVLGGYDLAKQLVYRFIMLIRNVVSQITLPMLANHNDNNELVIARFIDATKIVSYICIPVCLTIAVFGKELTIIMYGEEYLDTVPIVVIYSIITMISSITSLYDLLGIIKGRTDLNFKNTIFRICMTLPLITFGCLYGINYVALAYLLVSIIGTVYFWKVVVMRTYPMNWLNYLSSFSKYLAVCTFVSMFFLLIKTFINNALNNTLVLQLVIDSIIYLTLYLLAFAFFLRKEFGYLIKVSKVSKQ